MNGPRLLSRWRVRVDEERNDDNVAVAPDVDAGAGMVAMGEENDIIGR
jgi:hypothetical protein